MLLFVSPDKASSDKLTPQEPNPQKLPRACNQARPVRTRIRPRLAGLITVGVQELLGLTGLVAWLGMVWWVLSVVR